MADWMAEPSYGSSTGANVLRCLRMMVTWALFASACTPLSVLLEKQTV